MQKKTKIHAVPNENPEGTQEEWQRKIAPILGGQAPAPNEFVGYLVKQVVGASDERATLLANLQQLNSRAGQMRERVVALDGQINARLHDMRAWWDCPPSMESKDAETFTPKFESEKNNGGNPQD